MKDPTLERSHTSAKLVVSGSCRKENYKYIKDPTLERSPTSVKAVTSGLVVKQFWEYIKDPMLERSHTSAKLVTSGLLRREHFKGMKNCTLDSSHIPQITMKHLLAGFVRRNWAVLPSSLTTMRNTWSCLDIIVGTCKSIWCKITNTWNKHNREAGAL